MNDGALGTNSRPWGAPEVAASIPGPSVPGRRTLAAHKS
jgi:hypothetical protein